MTKLFYIFILLISFNKVIKAQKQTQISNDELNRITKNINIAGSYIEKSGKLRLQGWACIGVGGLLNVTGVYTKIKPFNYMGSIITFTAIPLFISSSVKLKKGGTEMMKINLSTPQQEILENNLSDTINRDSSLTKITTVEPKYKIGQTVFYNKNDTIIEAKIITVEYIGLRIEYFDDKKKKKVSRFVNYESISLDQPSDEEK